MQVLVEFDSFLVIPYVYFVFNNLSRSQPCEVSDYSYTWCSHSEIWLKECVWTCGNPDT